MKFNISLTSQTLLNTMRDLGYTPEGADDRTGEQKFYKSLRGARYPRFHVYCRTSEDSASCTLHLDQKQPSYKGSSAHSGEYDGDLVESELEKIQSLSNT